MPEMQPPRSLRSLPPEGRSVPSERPGGTEILDFNTWQALVQLQADYARALDTADWERWPGFFTDPCSYRLQARENHERGLPLATLSFESVGMLKDRVFGIRETLFHDPYYQRHVLSPPLILGLDSDEDGGGSDKAGASGWRLRCETHYAVFRTKPDGPSTVFNVGRYLDTVVRTPAGLRFAERLCVFDSEMVPNALIYPI